MLNQPQVVAMDDATRFYATTVYLQAGIVPLIDLRNKINVELGTLPEEERRKMKRKFRKLWRAALRRELRSQQYEGSQANKQYLLDKYVKPPIGTAGTWTTAGTRAYQRKLLVQKYVWTTKIVPLVQAFRAQGLEKEGGDKSKSK